MKLIPIISEIYDKKIYDTQGIEVFKCICDVGAHIGLFTLKTSKQSLGSKIIAVEADPTNYKYFLRNVSINGLKNRVQGLNAAVGQGKGTATLWLSKSSRGDNSTKKWHDAGSAGHIVVSMLPLDDILSNEKLCDLMKLDVEGSETEVLKGLEKQYSKVNRLVMEAHTSVVNIDEIHKWLYRHDFTVKETRKIYEDCLLLKAQHNAHSNSL